MRSAVFATAVTEYRMEIERPLSDKHRGNLAHVSGLSKSMEDHMVAAHAKALVLQVCPLDGSRMTTPLFIPGMISQGGEAVSLALYCDGSRRQDLLPVDQTRQETFRPNLDMATVVAASMGTASIDMADTHDNPPLVYSRVDWDAANADPRQVALSDGLRTALGND